MDKELSPDDDTLLCIDISDDRPSVTTIPRDPDVHLRQTLEKIPASPASPYLADFASVFTQEGFNDLPPRRSWDHAIELKPSAETKPVTSKIYSLSRSEQHELDKFLEEHLRSGRIRPSKSPMASPFFFVKKKCGTLRPVQDYRRLNEMTIKNRYPLPLISELMDKLKGAKYFTKLDVRWGYENVRIKEGDEWKAAFLTNRGLFEPTVMFFGLTNSPATFQNMMNDIFHELLLTDHLLIYMDDLLIFTDDLTTHRILTRQVLGVLQKHNLFLKPEKCFFEVLEIEFLGVIISHGNIRMDPKKIDALQSWPTPNSKKEVQQFLGFVNFYRRFVKDFAKTARPLNRLCGSVPWTWSSIENDAFLALRNAVASGPTLAIPLDDAPFRIEADSSGYATGAVLSQLQHGLFRPVAFISKALNDVERNYDIHDRELLSIMRALSEWRKYLHGSSSPFEIHSDHKNLQYFMTNQKLNRRQARWSLELSEFNFTLLHKPGSSMTCADALSRRPDFDKGLQDNDSIVLLKPEHLRRSFAATYENSPIVEEIRLHSTLNASAFDEHRSSPGWSFDHGITCWFNRIVVPNVPSLREKIIKENHDSILAGHPGRNKTVELVQRDFWWATLTKDCHKYVDGCAVCQRSKPLRQKPLGLLSPNEIPQNYWQIISCDFVTDLPSSKGFNSVMVCVDRLSKMVRLIPCNKNISSESAAKKYRDHVWKDFGLPSKIISDRGPQFVSSFTRALNSLLGISENFSTARHPQTDGQTERSNQEMEQYLRIFCGKRQHDWAEWLACAEFSINNKINSSTGYSPFFLNYGRDPPRPLLPLRKSESGVPRADAFAKQMAALTKETSTALALANSAMKKSYDKHHRDCPPLLPGSLVLLDAKGLETKSPSRKLDDKRHGPFEVVEQIGDVSYRIKLPSSWKIHDVFHLSKLTPFTPPAFPSQSYSPQIPDIQTQDDRTLQKILLHKDIRNKIFYLALFSGDSPEDARWVPHEKIFMTPDPNRVLTSYYSSLN